jgi:hypothetical protein
VDGTSSFNKQSQNGMAPNMQGKVTENEIGKLEE